MFHRRLIKYFLGQNNVENQHGEVFLKTILIQKTNVGSRLSYKTPSSFILTLFFSLLFPLYMGQLNSLTKQRKENILALSHEIVSEKQIASIIKMSNIPVHCFLEAQIVGKFKKIRKTNEI